MRRLTVATGLAAACILAGDAMAQGRAGAPPTCARDLFQNEAGLRRQQTRLEGVANADLAAQCRVFREHVGFLQGARAVFATCQTGREREQNVALMDSELSDYRALLAGRCGKR
jgi:hypothetical protein